jgi:CheY-like chemotaxis protein
LIESGKLVLSLEPVDLSSVMMECQTMVETQAQRRGVSVIFPALDGDCFVLADRIRVKQVLINLLTNAIKYNNVNGKVLVSCVPLADSPGRLRIFVADDGNGLTAEKIQQLFQPFNRLGQEANTVEGTGIGLVMSKRLIEMMGGVIGVESTVGAGSVFWVEINLAQEQAPTLKETKTAPTAKPQTVRSEQLHTLLYVEDNSANLMLMEGIMEGRPDIHLLTARDAERGIAVAREQMPDVILMDISLPGMSGIKALTILAIDPLTTHIPVLALSANAIPHDIEKGLIAGFHRYLTKPIKVDEFMASLDEALTFVEAKRQCKIKNTEGASLC